MLGYDKMGQVRWMVDRVRKKFRDVWRLGKFLTIDKMIICHQHMYCIEWQYMLKTPQKWGIKEWCLADAKLHFVYNLDIYCGRNGIQGEIALVRRGEPLLAQNIVMKLMVGNHWKGHCIVMNNYFTSVGLFKELLQNGTYAIGTICTNRIGILQQFKNTRDFNCELQGTLVWKMHNSCEMASVMWKDKRMVVLLSTNVLLIDFLVNPRFLCHRGMVQFGMSLKHL